MKGNKEHLSEHEGAIRLGDKIEELAEGFANKMNESSIMNRLRERNISLEEYKRLIASVYPVVVGFNRGLIKSIVKLEEAQNPEVRGLVQKLQTIDHVRNSGEIEELARQIRILAKEHGLLRLRAIAGQLEEEQEHNNYFRDMLRAHGIDHEALYARLEEYLRNISMDEKDKMTQECLASLERGEVPDSFRGSPVSQAATALSHYLSKTSSDPRVSFSVYNSLQSAIEFTLVKVVSKSVYPGVAPGEGHTDFNSKLAPDASEDRNTVPPSIRWWDEHASYGKGGKIEMQHIAHGKKYLNEHVERKEEIEEALGKTSEVLELFSALVG